MNKPRIAIIGAGISGITLAKELEEIAKVKIFEKSRGVGGRMSTRYAEDFVFDHGVQCFTARSKIFQRFVRPFILSGDIGIWQGKVINIDSKAVISPRIWFETHLVATPNMNSLCKKLAKNLDITLSTEVITLSSKEKDGWHLKDKNNLNLGVFDFVISTAPPAQTLNLFQQHLKQNNSLEKNKMKPCFSLMLGFKQEWQQDWIFAKVEENPIKLIAVNSSKPMRDSSSTSLVIHSSNSWSKKNVDQDITQIQQTLLENFSQLTKINYQEASYISTHRWLYALVEKGWFERFLDRDLGLAATGDWVSNSRIEDVWISAINLANEIKILLQI